MERPSSNLPVAFVTADGFGQADLLHIMDCAKDAVISAQDSLQAWSDYADELEDKIAQLEKERDQYKADAEHWQYQAGENNGNRP